MTGIDHFEALVQQLVEGTFGRLFPPPLQSGDLVRSLWQVMERERQALGGQVVLPNRYWVLLSPSDHVALQADAAVRLDEDIHHCLHRLAREMRGQFSGHLMVSIHPAPGVAAGLIEVRAAHAPWPAMDAGETHEMGVATDQSAEANLWTVRLGQCTYRLGEPVICLGRALSNDIILDDRRVSRRHARLRWREGRYHLTDLDSREGVSINGHALPRGAEHPLMDGDHIGIAGLVLVVGRDGVEPLEGMG